MVMDGGDTWSELGKGGEESNLNFGLARSVNSREIIARGGRGVFEPAKVNFRQRNRPTGDLCKVYDVLRAVSVPNIGFSIVANPLVIYTEPVEQFFLKH